MFNIFFRIRETGTIGKEEGIFDKINRISRIFSVNKPCLGFFPCPPVSLTSLEFILFHLVNPVGKKLAGLLTNNRGYLENGL